MQFYSDAFSEVKIHTEDKYLTDTPSKKPVGSTMTVLFSIYDFTILALNGGGMFTPNPSLSFMVHCTEQSEVDHLWHALHVGGKVLMELGSYDFSERYCWIEDKYGVSWQIMHTNTPPKEKITPCLLFVNKVFGKAKEAMDTYVRIFGEESSINFMTSYGEKDPEHPEAVLFADYSLWGQTFVAMDSSYPHEFNFSEGVSFVITCKDQSEIDYFYDNLSHHPDAEMCGWLKDKYGVSWQLVTKDVETMLSGPHGKEVMATLMKMKRINVEDLKKAAQ